MDESYTRYGKNDSFVLAGCIASAEAWAAFIPEWETLLPEYGQVGKDGTRYFHASEAPKGGPEQELFWRVIERHVPVLVSCQFYLHEFERAKARIYHPSGLPLKVERNVSPYTLAFFCLMNTFHAQLPKFTHEIPKGETVDFHFDDNPEHKGFFRKTWSNHMARMPADQRRLYGVEPRYEDDKKCRPLQAADFWASWKRRWYDEGGKKRAYTNKFDTFERSGERKRLYIDINWDEDGLTQLMAGMGEGRNAETGEWRPEPLFIRPKA